MSEIYHRMYLVDLETDSVIAYSSREKMEKMGNKLKFGDEKAPEPENKDNSSEGESPKPEEQNNPEKPDNGNKPENGK